MCVCGRVGGEEGNSRDFVRSQHKIEIIGNNERERQAFDDVNLYLGGVAVYEC